jgi:hypothetical protein
MTDEELDYVKSRLYQGFGVEIRPDLQVRAEIILQPEDGRWVFTPEELNGGGPQLDTRKLEPRCRVAVPAHAPAIHRAVQSTS